MCKAPNTLPDGTVVSCRECPECRDQAINDWVGRCIAEQKTAIRCHAVTLTYGRNKANDASHERSALLTYSDIQKYLKLLRRHGYPVRYLVAGEYGSKKGRAHWHLILYWQDKVPDHVLDQNFIEQHWPHGWSFWTEPTWKAFRYNCKYIQKDMRDGQAQGHLAMSKKPPLGAAYFRKLAEQYVEQGLVPQSLNYSFPESRLVHEDGTSTPWVYRLKGRSAELYLQHYIDTWRRKRPALRRPASEIVDLFEKYGKVVLDEDRMLRREQFPRGESRAIFPTGEAIKANVVEVRQEEKQKARERAFLEKDVWFDKMIRSAKNGEERSYWEGQQARWYEEHSTCAGPGGKQTHNENTIQTDKPVLPVSRLERARNLGGF